MKRIAILAALGGVLLLSAQPSPGQRGRPRVPAYVDEIRWENDSEYPNDCFTFVRIRYDSWGDRRWRGRWATDWPDAELNFSYRLQQLTSIKVAFHEEGGKVLELTDPEIYDHPFIYIVEPGGLHLTEDEVQALRRYLTNGGFLMVDDFWGTREYQNFYHEIKRVFPDREPVDLSIEHPIFQCVYPLTEKPQLPSIQTARAGRPYGITWERGEDGRHVNYRAIYDDNDRMMVVICHNTDLGDGWEREGDDEWYFREFSEPKAYPMGINIIYYAMTH